MFRRSARCATPLASLLAAGTLTAVASPAAGGDDFTRSGPYLSLSALYASDLYEEELEDQLADALGPVSVDIRDSYGITARAGLRFLSILAVELQYDWVGDYDVDIDVPGLTTETLQVEVEQHTITANARLNITIGPVQPFLLAGVGIQHVEAEGEGLLGTLIVRDDTDQTVLAGRIGAGVEVYLTDHLGVTAEGLVVLTDEGIAVSGFEVDNVFYAGAALGLTYRY